MIYFLRCEVTGLVKIGYSTDERTLRGRVSDLRIGCPTPTRFVAVVSGSRDDERDYHLVQRRLRSHGEWFRIPLEDLPPDELGLADVLNALPSREIRADRQCTKCGEAFFIRRGMSRWKPRKNGKGAATNRQMWCHRCVDDRRAALGEPERLAAAHGLPAALIKRYLASGLSSADAVQAAMVDKVFMAEWKRCRDLGIGPERISKALARGASFDDIAKAGPGKVGRPKGSRNTVRTVPAPQAERIGPLATWLSDAGVSIKELAEMADVSRSTIHRCLRGEPIHNAASGRLSKATNVPAAALRSGGAQRSHAGRTEEAAE